MLTACSEIDNVWIQQSPASQAGPSEKEAIAGALGFCSTVPLNRIIAVAIFVQLAYALIVWSPNTPR